MKKGINIVILGVLTVASVILALPFTPLRNSFTGVATSTADQAITSLGVDLNGKIKNARLVARTHQYEVLDFGIDNMSGKNRKISGAFYNNGNGLMGDGTYNAIGLSLDKNKRASSGADGSMGMISGEQKSDGSTSQNFTFVGISSKLGTTSTGGTVKQSGNAQNDGTGGGTHPGVDPIIPPSLPLGNGFMCLFSFAIIYVGFKKWN